MTDLLWRAYLSGRLRDKADAESVAERLALAERGCSRASARVRRCLFSRQPILGRSVADRPQCSLPQHVGARFTCALVSAQYHGGVTSRSCPWAITTSTNSRAAAAASRQAANWVKNVVGIAAGIGVRTSFAVVCQSSAVSAQSSSAIVLNHRRQSYSIIVGNRAQSAEPPASRKTPQGEHQRGHRWFGRTSLLAPLAGSLPAASFGQPVAPYARWCAPVGYATHQRGGLGGGPGGWHGMAFTSQAGGWRGRSLPPPPGVPRATSWRPLRAAHG